ncbi:MAG: glycosyltransferase family 2 protein, partial [Planctomycetota bacterium]
RALGARRPGALSLPQSMGNLICALLMRICYRRRVTDLGPFRAIDRRSLERLHMCDPDFGWTAEMQVKAFRLGLRYHELPVDALPRTAGESKISGRLLVGVRAGWIILRTILHHRHSPLESPRP